MVEGLSKIARGILKAKNYTSIQSRYTFAYNKTFNRLVKLIPLSRQSTRQLIQDEVSMDVALDNF